MPAVTNVEEVRRLEREWHQHETLAPPPYTGILRNYLKGIDIGDPLIDNLNANAFISHEEGVKLQWKSAKSKCPLARMNAKLEIPDPDWVDWDLIEKGQAIWREHLGRMVVSLCCALVTGFSIARFAVVLLNSGYADNDQKAFERYATTAHYVIDWITESLRKGGRGREAAEQVRKMHGLARKKSKSLFDQAKGEGVPLSQFDMAEVLLGFAIVSIQFMEVLMDVKIPYEDKVAMTATWRYIGHLLGIQDEFNPCKSWEELYACYEDYQTYIVPRLSERRRETDLLQQTALAGFGKGSGVGSELFRAIMLVVQNNEVLRKLPGFQGSLDIVRPDEQARKGMQAVGAIFLKAFGNDKFNAVMGNFFYLEKTAARSSGKKKRDRIYRTMTIFANFNDLVWWRFIAMTIRFRKFFAAFSVFMLVYKLQKKMSHRIV